MPAPAHVHIVVSGALAGGEVFAFGYDTLGEAGNQATLDAAVAAAAAVFTTSGASKTTFQNLLTTAGSYTRVTGYSYGAGAGPADLVSAQDIVVPGLTSGQGLPNQCALVATLRTPIPSRRTRGRMYLPASGAFVSSTGFLSAPNPQAVADAVKALITSNGEAISPVVISQVGDLATAISAVTVNSRLDVQRRRANKQPAGTVGTAVVP